MASGRRIDRTKCPQANRLTTFLRRYKNDSLISWSLGLSVEEVAAARAKVRPIRQIGTYVKAGGNMEDAEYTRRRREAARSNDAYLAAVGRLR